MSNKSRPRQAFSITTSTSRVKFVDVADPRYITFIVRENARFGQNPRMKRIIRFNPRVLDLHKLNTARKGVFETNETIEHILSFPPAKTLFGVRRVSKHWKDVIATSVHLQEKMFLRLKDKPQELWTLDAKHKVGANNYGRLERFHYLNDTEMKLRRIEFASNSSTKIEITPADLNPMLQQIDTRTPITIRMHMNLNRIEEVEFTGRADVLRHAESDLWNTYLTDPPCHRVKITYIGFYFRKAPPVRHYGGSSLSDLLSGDASMMNEYFSESRSLRSDPITAELFLRGPVNLQSDAGLTMGDVFKAASQTRGDVSCKFSNQIYWEGVGPTMLDAIDVVKTRLGVENVWTDSYVRLGLTVDEPRPTTLLFPTEEDRVMANANWKPSR